MQLVDKLSKQTKLIIACLAVFVALLIAFGVLPVEQGTAPTTVGGLFVFACFAAGFDYLDNKEAVKVFLGYLNAIQFSPEVRRHIQAGKDILSDLEKSVEEAEAKEPPNAG